ncbi:MAG: hypothetical protein K1X65_06680 [Caldilineales bacterium]|nr:hypothetical protein [Caldilineales bacterium]MCW5860802.1 hypothetical protein [Caldilineales bacterium]
MTTETTNIADQALLETIDPVQATGSGPDAGEPGNDPNEPPFRPVHLPEGILAGYDFSPDALKEARRIMWPDRSEKFG